MKPFTYHPMPQTVVMDSGNAAARLEQTINELNVSRIMLLTSAREGDRARRLTGKLRVVLHWTEVAQHVPVDLAQRARASAEEAMVDAIVCIGGGSAIGLAKAIALTCEIPIIAVPTTYAGSEATPVWGLTEHGVKTTGHDLQVLPRTVILDSALSQSLPLPMTVTSAFNAIAHSVDSMWAPATNPVVQAMALEGARNLSSALLRIGQDPGDLTTRDQLLSGSYLAAAAFATAGSGLHHNICHVLGGSFGLPHAETHAIVLPHVLALNAPTAPHAAEKLAHAFTGGARAGGTGTDPAQEATRALVTLVHVTGAPRGLRHIGMQESDLVVAAEQIMSVVPPSNPALVDQKILMGILRRAWAGEDPTR